MSQAENRLATTQHLNDRPSNNIRPAARLAIAAIQFLLVFLLIYAPVLNLKLGVIFYADSQAFLCVILIVLGAFLARGAYFQIPRSVLILTALLTAIVSYGLVAALFFSNSSGTLHAALRPIRSLITLWGIYSFLRLQKKLKREVSELALIQLVFLAISAHGALMVLQFVFPAVRDFIYEYTFADQMLKVNQQYRMAGLSMAGGAQISVFQAIGIILLPFLLVQAQSATSIIFYCSAAAVDALSILLSGRSGVIVIVVLFVPSLILAVASTRKAARFQRLLVVGSACLVCALVAFAAFSAVDHLDDYIGTELADLYELAQDRTLQTFRGEDETIPDLRENHLLFPSDAKTFIFGNPRLIELDQGYDDRILQSDSGYVRFLFGYGAIGSALNYLVYLYIIVYSWRRRSEMPISSRISILLAVLILIFHIKEIFVLTRIGLSITCLVFLGISMSLSSGPLTDNDHKLQAQA